MGLKAGGGVSFFAHSLSPQNFFAPETKSPFIYLYPADTLPQPGCSCHQAYPTEVAFPRPRSESSPWPGGCIKQGFAAGCPREMENHKMK